MATRQMIQSSPFLPLIPAIASGDLGRVQFPGTQKVGRGLLSSHDRNPHDPVNDEDGLTGPSTYTRQAEPTRLGGIYQPRALPAGDAYA